MRTLEGLKEEYRLARNARRLCSKKSAVRGRMVRRALKLRKEIRERQEERKLCIVVEWSSASDFEDEVNALLKDGYTVLSSNCGFIDSENYNFASSFMAILLDKECIL